MSDFFTASVLVATIASAVRLATPYLFAALGEAIGQRSGVLNLGVDGVMLLAAFGAYFTVLKTDNLWLAVGVGMAIGVVMGVIYAVVTVSFHAQQGISGIGIFLFGLGFSDLLFQEQVGTPKPVSKLPKVEIPLLADIPHIGEMLFRHTLMTYAAFILVPVVTFMLMRTTFGLNIRAVGENPEAADSLGVSVARTRYTTIIIGNLFAGVAGTSLVLGLGIFQNNLTNGQGFIAVALVYFGAWRPVGIMAGAMLYGLVSATVLQWKVLDIIPTSASDLAAMAPALLTIIVLVVVANRVHAPAALTRDFDR